MSRHIIVEHGKYIPASKREVEVVERKGVGHPDSLIDGIMEEISRELSKTYINEFGRILHHNVDKGQLCGGATTVDFGGGQFTKPIFILLSGRATTVAEGKSVSVQHIAHETAHKYLSRVVEPLDVENDVEIDSRISDGSPDLVDVFLRGPKIPFSNDTSFGTGYAPFSDLERIVLETEKYLNSPDYKKQHPEIGTDIKVMGCRSSNTIRLTVAIAFVSKHVHNTEDYVRCKERVTSNIIEVAKKLTALEVQVFVNTGDSQDNSSVYITLTGTSAEMGDDGSVGRGNRVNGLITPMRSMSMEAAAGKNPVNHVGKIYSVLAHELAGQIAEEHPDIEDVAVTILSQIGKPIDQPKVASVSILANDGRYENIKSKAHYIVDRGLEQITEITNRIVFGKVNIF